jgi:integrase
MNLSASDIACRTATLFHQGGQIDMARRRGRQKGYLKSEGPSWIGYWWEEVRLADGRLDWHRTSKAICANTRVREASGRTVTVTKREAQRVFQETVLDKLEIRTTNPQSLATLKEFVEMKFRPTLVLKRRKTQEHWHNMLDNHILRALGTKQLRDIRPDDVQNLILEKVAVGLSTQTVWHIRTAISTLFKKAKRIGWYSGDLPTDGLEMPKLTHVERTALTREQAIALLEHLPFMPRAMVLVLALTGLRIGELTGLRWRRVNLSNSVLQVDSEQLAPFTLAVRESYVRVYGSQIKASEKGGQYQDVKTRKSRRDVPMVGLVVKVLKMVHDANNHTGPDDPVFAGRNRTPIDGHNELARKLKPVLKALNMPNISWHDLRHTAATFGDIAGLTEAERERILGHSDERMTRHYTKVSLEHVRAAMEKMADGFDVLDRPPKVVEIRKKTA